MSYPLIPAALANERIADLHRAASRRDLVLAALRGRRRRPRAEPDAGRPSASAPTRAEDANVRLGQAASSSPRALAAAGARHSTDRYQEEGQ
jgi:hypothetical protein